MNRPLQREYRQPELVLRGRTFSWGARTYLMGVVNVTPDSFSGDGVGVDARAAGELARRLDAEGADIIDIGAESTRPGAAPVTQDEELKRLAATLDAVRAATALPVSVDTHRARVASFAIEHGADLINDVTGLQGDPQMAGVVAGSGLPVVAMHNQRGREHTELAADIRTGCGRILDHARAASIDDGKVILDPGFGFGWQPRQNLEMLRRLPELWDFKLPLLLGVSRKSTLGLVLDRPVQERGFGTAAAVAASIAGGADIVRVHEMAEMRDVARVTDAIVRDNWRPT